MYKIIGADGKEYGPIPTEVLAQWIAEGRANAQSKALAEGGTEWKTLAELPEFAVALARAAAAPAAAASPIYGSHTPKTNSLALAGLIFGIISVTCGLCCCYGFPFNLAGIICSGIALAQMKSEPQPQGRGLAIAGLVLSLLSILLAALFFVLGLAFNTPDILRKIQGL